MNNTSNKMALFIGDFAKVEKTISFIMCVFVRPALCNNSANMRRIFMKIDIREYFENLSREFKYDKNNE
jgi:hypothetical protein